MSASLGSAFGKTVQTITSTKLKELAEQRATFEEKYNTLIGTENAESDAMRRHAHFDPSVSSRVLPDWEKTLLQYLSIQSTKSQYTDLYEKLVTKWLSPEKSIDEDSDVQMTENFVEVPDAKKLTSCAEWESNAFQAAEVDERALKSCLEDHFIADKRDGAVALNVILTELSDILNVRMTALDRWTWGSEVSLEQRRKINGDFLINFDPDLLQAIFLHYIGIKWSVFLKYAFWNLHKHKAWQSKLTEVSKLGRLRSSYFPGEKGTYTLACLKRMRKSTHHNMYFAHQLLEFDSQEIEGAEGEEEAGYGG
ncbi:hypothetical protein TW65_01523 [Stemphylium lycopersici]|nr:hypothetical protein TW65_01523 [Stemphylium lycopersici]